MTAAAYCRVPANGFSPDDTFDSGQCFRWERRPDGSYCGVVSGRVLTVALDGDELVIGGLTPAQYGREEWARYFDLNRDYGAICRSLEPLGPAMAQAFALVPGVRILRQEPWETLCSFLISQNNNIPRIRGIIARLCETFGEPCGEGRYSFPPPEALCGLDAAALAPLRCGFRAPYLIDAARKVADGAVDFAALETLPLGEARRALQTIRGVGPKVAECVLLYALGRLDAFPVDVWIARALERLFPGRTAGDFGPYAGVAQQALFCYCRKIQLK